MNNQIKFVFELKEHSSDVELDLNQYFVGFYDKGLTGDLVVHIISDINGNEYNFKVPANKAEKLYQWK